MKQKQFSQQIFKFLEIKYPEFLKSIKFQEDESFDCDLKSESGIFSIWIATYNCEVTIGIEDPNGKTDIHTHISYYDLEDIEYCVTELSSIIEDTKNDKLILCQTQDGNYDWFKVNYINDSSKLTKKLSWKKNYNVT